MWVQAQTVAALPPYHYVRNSAHALPRRPRMLHRIGPQIQQGLQRGNRSRLPSFRYITWACSYVYIYIYVCVCTYVPTYVGRYVGMYLCLHVYVYVYE